MTTRRSALLVVQSDFLETHVGVRRVILHYAARLREAGVLVRVARQRGTVLQLGRIRAFAGRRRVRWGRLARREQFDLVIMTTPWICPEIETAWPNAVGLVYDLAPNLIGTGEVTLDSALDVYGFAHDHARGFESYRTAFPGVLCISEASAHDFRTHVTLRGTGPGPAVVVDIPYRMARGRVGVRRRGEVLMVNALDWRKNFATSSKALIAAAARTRFRVTIVGRERIPLDVVRGFIGGLTDAGIRVEWRRWVSDRRLHALYRRSTVLLFPSRYEGLGYPILEAQAQGCPVVSSDSSSCREINLNRGLQSPPDDVEGLASAILAVLGRRPGVLRGRALRRAQFSWLATRSRGAAALLPFARSAGA